MPVHDQPAPADTPFPGIAHVTLAGSAEGLSSLSLWRQSMAPGACTPPHAHCEEIVMCESGRGEVHVDGVAHQFRAGQTIVVPAGVPHQIFNTGDEPLVTLAVLAASPVHVSLPDGQPLELAWRT